MDAKLRACQAHKKESSGHTAIIFNSCLQALQYVLREDKNASEIFLFYNKVSDLLSPLIKSGGNGELLITIRDTCTSSTLAGMLVKAFRLIHVAEHLEIMCLLCANGCGISIKS